METKDKHYKEKARFQGKIYSWEETLTTPDGGEEIVVCIGPDGERRACLGSEWARHRVKTEVPANGASVTKFASTDEKIRLFAALFRGRRDVFALRYWSQKTGRSGYRPACRNEWRRGVCEKPHVKCSECAARDLMPLSKSVLYRHLEGKDAKGRDVAGVYPLLDDSSTWFLAADFDEEQWKQDAAAYRTACEKMGLSPAVERSRSGNGAHVWLFFSEPVPASDARRLGTGLLTRAMAERPQMSFASFDRLFPSQNTVPKGGFGNLIALPLQGKARENGNSLFVDAEFVAFDDQWAYLSSLPRITPDELAERLAQLPQDVLVPAAPADVPSETVGKVRIVLSNMLHVGKAGLSPRLLLDIKGIGAFRNQEFYKKQAMRLSVSRIPRIVDCTVDEGDFLALPRGCKEELTGFLDSRGIRYEIEDERWGGKAVDVTFTGTLREEQAAAADILLEHDIGVLSAGTGFGKTIVGAYIIGQKKTSTLILVPSSALLSQWKEALEQFLDVRDVPDIPRSGRGRKKRVESIGQIGAGKHTNAGIIDIAIVDSLYEGPDRKAKDFVKDYGLVICDECHHAAAFTVERVLRGARAKNVYGLSATPFRSDGLGRIIFMQCGPLLHTVSTKELTRNFTKIVSPRFTRTRTAPGLNFHDVCAAVLANPERNARIIADAVQACESGRTPLVLTSRLEHAAALVEGLRAATDAKVFLLQGSDSAALKRKKMEELRAAGPDEKIAVVAIDRYIGEGVDLPRLDTLLATSPVSGQGVVCQYAGRLHRDCPGKSEVRIYDYVDVHVPMLERMYRKRQRNYLDQGYTIRPADEIPGKSRVFSGEEYLGTFADDLGSALEEVYLCSSRATLERLREIGPQLKSLKDKGVKITIRLGKGDPEKVASGAAYLRGLGFDPQFSPETSYSAAIFDRRVVWYGAINFLGRPEGDALRFESMDVAGELLDTGAPKQLALDLAGG